MARARRVVMWWCRWVALWPESPASGEEEDLARCCCCCCCRVALLRMLVAARRVIDVDACVSLLINMADDDIDIEIMLRCFYFC